MAMGFLKHSTFACLGILVLTVLQVHAQNQTGFVSIDCGIPDNSGYTDTETGIDYISDSTFVESGVRYDISPAYKSDTLEQQFFTVRSFPEGSRNCYTIKPVGHDNAKFLIRARFMYGNYDGKGILPSFGLFIESDIWDTVELKDASTTVSKEIIHIPQNNYIFVCLLNKDSGTPFISALEVRPVKNSSYEIYESGSLVLFGRYDVGNISNKKIRYKDDIYDRIWFPSSFPNWATISNQNYDLDEDEEDDDYQLPLSVMNTAVTPANVSNPLQFHWETNDTKSFYLFLHIAELEVLQPNQTREMNISGNGKLWHTRVTPFSSMSITESNYVAFKGTRINISIIKTEDSTLPPIFNALEIYWLQESSQLLTNQQDVDAIINIKKKYGVKNSNWQADPCVPKLYIWKGLDCSYDSELPRIVSLNLSSSGLSGEITPYILGLSSLQSLDLSNNNLTGSVPEFLTQLQNLRVLYLKGNNLGGSIPTGLKEKADNGSLLLSVDENSNICPPGSCKEKIKFNIVPVVASVSSVSVILAAIAIIWNLGRNKAEKKGTLELKNRRFSYSDVVRITNNFERVLGKGGFGTVYHGYLDDTQVAVKMLSPSSAQGYKEFQAEVELLTRVHHKSLTSLIGYCDKDTNMGLIYEFMANGNLEAHLLENQADIMKWEERLRIATEAAQGLEYLHSGCKPPIVHRDVKSTNILLNEKFQAKLSDFGLSRIFAIESGTHVSTKVAGTPGYLDPEYYSSNRLTEKSDVYSFGVVLLTIITGKPVIQNTSNVERTHISQWVSFMLAMGDIKNIVDPRLNGDFDTNSVWKAVEIAMVCVSPASAKRPTMNQVVMELNESLVIEVARKKMGQESEISNDSMLSFNLNLDTELSPRAR